MPDNSQSRLASLLENTTGAPCFPDPNIDYLDRFTRIDQHLNAHVHPHVNQGGPATERIWLTDHGPDHIATVIRIASELTASDATLTPYEAYCLLIAIHFHDVGNVFGRDEHERRVNEVLFSLDQTLIGSNAAEKRMISDIAKAHGGYADDQKKDKDTISKLPYAASAQPSKVDAKKLAAILRFADELADDRTRTNRFVNSAVKRVMPESEVFHAYAEKLYPAVVNLASQRIELRFELNVDDATRLMRKRNEQTLLLDEIFARTLKMHHEHIYCSRFMAKDIPIDSINVEILICASDYSSVLGEIKYSMSPVGYPVLPLSLDSLCTELNGVNGDVLSRRIKQLPEHTSAYRRVNLLAPEQATSDAGNQPHNHEHSGTHQKQRRSIGQWLLNLLSSSGSMVV